MSDWPSVAKCAVDAVLMVFTVIIVQLLSAVILVGGPGDSLLVTYVIYP